MVGEQDLGVEVGSLTDGLRRRVEGQRDALYPGIGVPARKTRRDPTVRPTTAGSVQKSPSTSSETFTGSSFSPKAL